MYVLDAFSNVLERMQLGELRLPRRPIPAGPHFVQIFFSFTMRLYVSGNTSDILFFVSFAALILFNFRV